MLRLGVEIRAFAGEISNGSRMVVSLAVATIGNLVVLQPQRTKVIIRVVQVFHEGIDILRDIRDMSWSQELRDGHGDVSGTAFRFRLLHDEHRLAQVF